MSKARGSWDLGVRQGALFVVVLSGWAAFAQLGGLPPRVAAGLALGAVLAVGYLGLLASNDPDGRRARAAADTLIAGAAALLALSLDALTRPFSFASDAQGYHALTRALGLGLAAGVVAALLLRRVRAPRGLSLGAAIASLALLAAGALASARQPSPTRYLDSLELFARLPPATTRAADETIPLGAFNLTRACAGGRCALGLAPRDEVGAAARSARVIAADRELSVHLDPTRHLLAFDDTAKVLLFDARSGLPVPFSAGGLRPRLAPPPAWIALGLFALLAAGVAARAARRRDEGALVDAELRDDGAVVAQGRAVQVAVPRGMRAGPVVVWVDQAPGAAHYRDDAPARGRRVEPGTVARHRAQLASRLASRWTFAASLALLGAAPLAGWAVCGVLPGVAPADPARAEPPSDGFSVRVLRAGHGRAVTEGAQVSVHYTGSLTNGRVFDSSRDREPFRVTLGEGRVIAGFERGMRGMRVGEVRRVTIPSALGYGERGHPPTIPANATLVFEIELLGVE